MSRSNRDGMRFKALIVRTGVPLPPPSGPARTTQCLGEGMQRLAAAERLHGEAMTRLGPLLPGGWRAAPPTLGLDVPGSGPLVRAAGRRRVSRWFRLARALQALRRTAQELGVAWVAVELDAAEAAARRGLAAAADAYNFFEDARWDLPTEARLVDEQNRDLGSLRDALSRAHALVHNLGALVGGLFGCELTHDDGDWFDECIASLLHVRYGNSMGFTARHVCTVCGDDFADCAHERGRTYGVAVARRDDGACTVCGARDCAHLPGEVVEVRAHSMMADIDLHEVSMVPRPRDPLARITARQVDRARLEEVLGARVEAGMRLLGHDCMHQCEGFRRPDAGADVEWLAS
jgi:hypothetical protein